MKLNHRHFIVGITGGIAAYKTCTLIRRLQDEGASVQVVMTEAGSRFVSALTFQALSGRPVYGDAWSSPSQSGPANGMAHIDLSREADAILVAPASADFLAGLVQGQAKDLLGSLCLARDIPLLVAPAMNRQMWQQPATQRNVGQLRKDGVDILGPGSGAQACGETGDGRMLEPEDLLHALMDRFGPNATVTFASTLPNIRGLLEGKTVVMTAGPTFEPIDPVRGITNRSSGKMGFALAAALRDAGARVLLITGPVSLKTPDRVARTDVTTGLEMHAAVRSAVSELKPDLFIGVAAVADWRPAAPSAYKLKKESGGTLAELQWLENPDILADVAQGPDAPFCVGFAAETGSLNELKERLPAKRQRKNIPLLVGNIGPDTFGAEFNRLVLCDAQGLKELPQASKHELAYALVSDIAKRLSHED
jgi:phosphopantothenoylcysteine decarboxylase/phosphopantothenate--cysteine ligase